jgi:hypothetical protein
VTDERRPPGLATVTRLPTVTAPQIRIRIHAVLENTDRRVYLGSRETDQLDPHSPANLGHVTALLRARGDLLDIHSGVTVYLQLGPRRTRAAQFRLHRSAPGTDPVLTDPVSIERPSRLCGCGLDLEPPEGIECWRPDLHPDPGPQVYAVAICGESPLVRRAVRREDRAGWRKTGTHIAPPDKAITWNWSDLGRCPADGLHPVRRLGL